MSNVEATVLERRYADLLTVGEETRDPAHPLGHETVLEGLEQGTADALVAPGAREADSHDPRVVAVDHRHRAAHEITADDRDEGGLTGTDRADDLGEAEGGCGARRGRVSP